MQVFLTSSTIAKFKLLPLKYIIQSSGDFNIKKEKEKEGHIPLEILNNIN